MQTRRNFCGLGQGLLLKFGSVFNVRKSRFALETASPSYLDRILRVTIAPDLSMDEHVASVEEYISPTSFIQCFYVASSDVNCLLGTIALSICRLFSKLCNAILIKFPPPLVYRRWKFNR